MWNGSENNGSLLFRLFNISIIFEFCTNELSNLALETRNLLGVHGFSSSNSREYTSLKFDARRMVSVFHQRFVTNIGSRSSIRQIEAEAGQRTRKAMTLRGWEDLNEGRVQQHNLQAEDYTCPPCAAWSCVISGMRDFAKSRYYDARCLHIRMRVYWRIMHAGDTY